MAGPVSRIKFTYQDYRNAPADKRYELLDGELVVVPSPRTDHQSASRNLGLALWDFAKANDLGACPINPLPGGLVKQ